jgi:HEAT repeat protein
VALAIIDLLERENAQVRSGEGNLDEEYSEYYASLIYRVAALRDDRAVDALVGALGTGMMASEGLADLGDPAIPALERLARSKDRSERWMAARVLSSIATRRTSPRFDLSTLGAEAVKRELSRLQADSDRHVREQATEGLAHFAPTLRS